MVSVSRARVHLLATHIGKDRIPIPRLFRDEPMHLGEWRRGPLRVGIVKGEAHAENVAAHEALAGVRLESRRIVVPPAVER